jgi:hypothetical protein
MKGGYKGVWWGSRRGTRRLVTPVWGTDSAEDFRLRALLRALPGEPRRVP